NSKFNKQQHTTTTYKTQHKAGRKHHKSNRNSEPSNIRYYLENCHIQ
ncbi:13122_t:CDS:1, partial [Acaulospora morrowiae]